MSSARKRSAIHKANREADHLRQQLMLAENHINILRTMAEAIGCGGDVMAEALERLAKLGNEPHYGNSTGNQIAIDALRKVGAGGTAPDGHN
jgi:hypothetical protein